MNAIRSHDLFFINILNCKKTLFYCNISTTRIFGWTVVWTGGGRERKYSHVSRTRQQRKPDVMITVMISGRK